MAFLPLIIFKYRVMIIDLDAHQGNGHEKDFSSDSRLLSFDGALLLLFFSFLDFQMIAFVLTDRVYILDMFNPGIYPLVSCLLLELSDRFFFYLCTYLLLFVINL